jgi:thiamine-monophosphate kinase
MSASRDEFSLIDDIRRRCLLSQRTRLGIGDDTALLAAAGDAGILITLDVLSEGVHFDLTRCTAEDVGRKALAVNLSDIAAMAGQPTAALVGLVLPRDRAGRLSGPLMDGLFKMADAYEVDVVGGDTNTWDGPLVISVTLLGEPTGRGAVTRSGAQSGDWLFVTGALGGSLAGRHLSFQPRISEALALHHSVELHAMIDLSDGIASDVRHIARESGVGVVIDAQAVPIHDDVDPALPFEERLHHALCDGEDFELLFAVAEQDGRRLLDDPPIDVPLHHIGKATNDGECRLQSPAGPISPLPEGGWVHRFRG